MAVLVVIGLPGGGAAQRTAAVADPGAQELTLEEALELALARDPAAVAAEAAVSSAEADRLQARGAWFPSLQLNTIYGNSSNQRFDQTTGRLVSESYTAQIQSGWDLFAGGRRWAQGKVAGAALEAATAENRAQRFRTILRTTESYFAAAASSELVRAAEQRLERARQQLEFARTRLELGTATASDELRAEIEVGNAELALLDAQSALRAFALDLGRLVGVGAEVHPVPGSLPRDGPALPPVETLVSRALAGSPEVIATEATAESMRALRMAAFTPYLPTLRLTGGYDWFAFEWPPDQPSWSLRLFASLPVFNGFQREAALQKANAAARVAEARARDASLAARTEVETATTEIALADRRVEISDRAVALAREDLRVQEERYRIGAATILDLQTSQVALAEAEVSAVRARQALGGAVARLEAILGEELTED